MRIPTIFFFFVVEDRRVFTVLIEAIADVPSERIAKSKLEIFVLN